MNEWDFWFASGLGTLDRDVVDADRLLREGRTERWGHRAPIHHRDDADELYVVVRGAVEVDGDSPVRLKNGDIFGMHQPERPPTFRAYDETEIVAITRRQFEDLVDDNGLLVSTRVRNGVRWSPLSIKLPFETILGVRPLERMARVVSAVGEEVGEREGERVQLPNLKPRHLSSLSALDRTSAKRAFDALVDASVLESPSGALIIPSVSELQRFTKELK